MALSPDQLIELWQERAETLWQILDDIDTYEDRYHPEMSAYYQAVHNAHKKRFKLADSDGYTLKWR